MTPSRYSPCPFSSDDPVGSVTRRSPGLPGCRGHDYREDIPDFVRSLFAPPVTDEQFDRVQTRLRERELHWAEQRVVAEQLARAREAIERELQTWSNAESKASA